MMIKEQDHFMVKDYFLWFVDILCINCFVVKMVLIAPIVFIY